MARTKNTVASKGKNDTVYIGVIYPGSRTQYGVVLTKDEALTLANNIMGVLIGVRS